MSILKKKKTACIYYSWEQLLSSHLPHGRALHRCQGLSQLITKSVVREGLMEITVKYHCGKQNVDLTVKSSEQEMSFIAVLGGFHHRVSRCHKDIVLKQYALFWSSFVSEKSRQTSWASSFFFFEEESQNTWKVGRTGNQWEFRNPFSRLLQVVGKFNFLRLWD